MEEIYTAQAFALNPPVPTVSSIRLIDTVTSNCDNPENCPITQLRLHRQLNFNIPTTSPSFATHQRCRVLQIRVMIKGLIFRTSHKAYSVELHNDGNIQDKYYGVVHSFRSPGRT